jgi:hypothetical protein
MFREIIDVYSESLMKHITSPYGLYAEILCVKTGGMYMYHCTLKSRTAL